MTLIHTVAPQDAQGTLAELYQQAEKMLGFVPNAFRLYSMSPVMLQNQFHQLGYFMQHPSLSFPLLAFVRMLVSQDNRCDYCIDLNAAMLMERAGLSVEQIAATRKDPAQAPLGEKDKAMLLFVLKATRTPLEVNAADVDALRAQGWTDGDIFDAVLHGARNMAADVLFNTFKIEKDL